MNNDNWHPHTKHQLWSERRDPHPEIWFEEQKRSITFMSKMEFIAWVLLGIALAIVLAAVEGGWLK